MSEKMEKYPKFFVPNPEVKHAQWMRKLVYCKLEKNGEVNYVMCDGPTSKSYWSTFIQGLESKNNRWKEIPIEEAALL